jgi:hypothetical protein
MSGDAKLGRKWALPLLGMVACLCATHSASAKLSAAPNTTTSPGPASGVVASVSTGGDLNGDGYSDLIVGYFGRVEIYLGSASGLHSAPDWGIEGPAGSPTFGASVSTAGDVNGDHVDDILVGESQLLGNPGKGRAYLWLGGANLASRPPGSYATPDWMVDGNATSAGGTAPYLGVSVSSAGDLNGDGFGDIAVGARSWSTASTEDGRAFVWLGKANFAAPTPVTPESADWYATGDTNSWLGFSVSSGGDVNGDGVGDLVIGAPTNLRLSSPSQGAVVVYFGQGLFQARPTGTLANADRVLSSSRLGMRVAVAGDVNGDGFADILASDFDNARLFAGGVSAPLSQIWSVPSAVLPTTFLPDAAATAGDVNGDGLADLIVGSYIASQSRVYFGRRGAAPNVTPDETRSEAVGIESMGVTAGDVNGDGYSDIATTSPGDTGAVSVYHGGGYPTAAASDFKSFGEQAFAEYGSGLGAAGDLNGDGFSDYVVGQPGFDDGEIDEGRIVPVYGASCPPGCVKPTVPPGAFEANQAGARQGASVAGAGDVDGDGYDDVIVGAPLFDAGAQVDAGRFQIYLGGPVGLQTTAALTRTGLAGAGAQSGFAVAGVGDVNGDGLGDVLVSAPYADVGGLTDAGTVYLYLGTAKPPGVGEKAAWSKSGTIANQHFGVRLGAAGDVNRDGYSDVVIGAIHSGPNGEVAAYVFHGQVNGLASSPAAVLVGAQAGDDDGINVASAGDVNGDSYADVAVGEPQWTGPSGIYQGRVRVFHGGPGGVSPTPATTLESPFGFTYFGAGIGGGGDVDGDGYGDLAIGAPMRIGQVNFEGRAHVYLGGPAGLATTESLEFTDTPGDESEFGRRVALNLDVNGDGFADLLVAGHRADRSGVDEGGVFVHFGGGSAGMPRTTRMSHSASGVPLALLGSLDATDPVEFHAQITFHSPAGRTSVAGDAEAKPLDQPFDGTGLVSDSLPVVPPLAGFVSQITEQCTSAVGCRWRMRVRSPNPYFPRAPWSSLPGNTPTESDLRGFVDSDADTLGDAADNCPFVANPLQTNSDVFPAGDACQCGDTDATGAVTAADVTLLRNSLAAIPPGLTTQGLARCDVITAPAGCNLLDLVVLRRAIAGAPPGIAQVCEANGAP